MPQRGTPVAPSVHWWRRAASPNLPEAHLALGSYYYWVFRDYERTLESLEVAERGIPGSYDLIMTEAYVAKRQGRFAEARARLERASELNPRSTQPFYELAIVLSWGQRRYSEARRYYEAVLNLDPDHEGALRELASIPLWRDGDTRPLRAFLTRLPPGSASGYFGKWSI